MITETRALQLGFSYGSSKEYDVQGLEDGMGLMVSASQSLIITTNFNKEENSVYGLVESFLFSLHVFSKRFLKSRLHFNEKYSINYQLPEDLQDLLNKMDEDYDLVQSRILHVCQQWKTENHSIIQEKDYSKVVTRMHNLKLDPNEVATGSATTHGGYQLLFRFCSEEQIEKCKNLLLEINGVDDVLLEKLPRLTNKYSKTVDETRKVAMLLVEYKVPIPKLSLLLVLAKQDYIFFTKEMNDGLYKGYADAAEKLKDSITHCISKIQEVIQVLEVKFLISLDNYYQIIRDPVHCDYEKARSFLKMIYRSNRSPRSLSKIKQSLLSRHRSWQRRPLMKNINQEKKDFK